MKKYGRRIGYFMLLQWLLPSLTAMSQAIVYPYPEVGHPLSRVYEPSEYHGHGQNFSVAQDKSGLMYFANFKGVLEYDGVDWKTIPTKNIRYVSSLLLDKKGRILVGANGEFGYLKDTLGAREFISLSAKIKEEISPIIQIIETSQGVYFISNTAYFHWDGRTVKVIRNKSTTQSAFAYKDKLLIMREKSVTLWDGKTSKPVQRGPDVPDLTNVVSVVKVNESRSLIVTSFQGLFWIENERITRAGGNASQVFMAQKATYATSLRDNSIAVGISDGGIIVISNTGNLLYPIVSGGAIRDSQASFLFTDREGNLWMALNDGIGKISIPSPISRYDNANGLKGEVTSIERFQGKLYVGTLYGLFYVENNRVTQVKEFVGGCLGLDTSGDALVAATNSGVFYWTGKGSPQQITSDFALSIKSSRISPGTIYVGLQDGLGIVKRNGGGWSISKLHTIEPADERPIPIVGIEENEDGYVWLETFSNGILRVDKSFTSYRQYSRKEGLANPYYNKLSFYNGNLLVTNKDGLFTYRSAQDRFEPYNFLVKEKVWFDRIMPDSRGDIWATRGDKKMLTFYRKNGTDKNGFDKIETPLMPISQLSFETILPENDQVTWVGGEQGLYRIDLKVSSQISSQYPVLLREVSTTSGKISETNSAASDTTFNGYGKIMLRPDENSISVVYALPSFFLNQEIQYQVYLENYDKKWSDWSSVTRRDYSGLPPGNYNFRVRAKDVYNQLSKEANLSFTILTPWYLKWYMYVLYAVVLALAVYYSVKWRLGVILKEKQGLERMIRERTEEVVSQKEELEKQSEELASTNDQLERIDEFVKSINSEVNTKRLFQLVLDRLCQFQNVDSASALTYNKATDNYQFIALSGRVSIEDVEHVSFTYEQAEQRYMDGGREVYEDIFLKNKFRHENINNLIDDFFAPKSLITILIRVEGSVKSFITLENADHENAFGQRDFNIVKNLKEHLIGAYIKTNILENLEFTLTNLKSTQEELIRQERLASVGQLTKGIVDRILNPLNYINNFSQSSVSLVDEIDEVTQKNIEGYSEDDRDDVESGMSMLKKNLEKIFEHGNSTTRIVKDMQKLLKGKSTEFFATDLNPFLESKVKSALQEVQAENKSTETIRLKFEIGDSVKVNLLPYEFSQVITNLISNACYTVLEKKKLIKDFVPEIKIGTEMVDGGIKITVRDNGKGIPLKETEQLFNPFFTTKPTSKGTGLGLFMSKDIIEYHKGRMTANSKENEYTEIEIFLPTISQ
ncbi:sensor histidine kinase [Dyadobacter helix]|nr:sensor histidine kinase [Dyadobacter sp. CECT 9275]